MTYTQRMASYVRAHRWESVSQRDRELAAIFFMDCVGCIVAGSGDTGTEALKRLVGREKAAPGAPTLGANSIRVGEESAALVNGVAAHIRDFDDFTSEMNGHSSAALVPALLAVAEETHATGAQILNAFTVGTEIDSLVGGALKRAGYDPGWDATGTVGVFGVTAAVGLLLGLSDEQLTNAFAIAMAMASGVKANNGSNVKDIVAGRTAANGIFAARAAALNALICNTGVMEDPRGLAVMTAPGFDCDSVNWLWEKKESVFADCGVALKLHPTCRGTHNAIDAAVKLHKELGGDTQQIQSVLCEAEHTALLNEKPADCPRRGKVNMAYCVALALLHGSVAMEDFMREDIPADVAELAKRVRVVEALFPGRPAYTTRVTVHRYDGAKLESTVERPKGDAKDMPTQEECMEKFILCAQSVLGKSKARLCAERLLHMAELPDVSELLADLTA